MKTDIVNMTKQSFKLKEGNAGAYRDLKQLDAGATYSIKMDPNATYREYVVATGKKGESIILTTDDFSEYKVIYIKQVIGTVPGAPVICKEGVLRGSAPAAAEGGGSDPILASEPSSAADPSGSVPPASSVAGVGSDPPPSSAASCKPALGIPIKNERVPWRRKLKQLFK